MAPKKASAKAAAKQGAKKSARASKKASPKKASPKKASPKKAPKVEKSIAKSPKAKAAPKRAVKSPKGASPKVTPKSVKSPAAPKSVAKSPRATPRALSPKRAKSPPVKPAVTRAKSPVTKPAAKGVTWAASSALAKSPKSNPAPGPSEGERLLAMKGTAHAVHKQVKLEKYQEKVLELRRAGAWALFPADAAKPPLVVKAQRTVTVGRHHDAKLRLEDRRISVFHAELRLMYTTSAQRAAQAPGLYVRSLSENNPVSVHGAKIRGGWAQLRAGDDVDFVPGIRYTVAGPEAPLPKAPIAEVQLAVAQHEPEGVLAEPPLKPRPPLESEDTDSEEEEEEWASERGVCCYCFDDTHTTDCCPHAAAAVKSSRIETALFYQGMRGPKRTGDRYTETSWI